MRKYQRHTRVEMLSHIEASKKSKQSQKVYCQQHGLAYSTFQYWIKKYRTKLPQKEADATVGFIPVHIQPDPQVSGSNQLHFLYPNGIQVMCPAEVHPQVLKSLINS